MDWRYEKRGHEYVVLSESGRELVSTRVESVAALICAGVNRMSLRDAEDVLAGVRKKKQNRETLPG